ncbi:Capsule assembly protein Wzi [Parapedobacter luteus]|uniref:Capsule assembly protein Wzi n=1 Tax=Parapedobacter luteus TaxID=623280 RepID=A0A1T5BN24_9SPHI|nr:capsule assembly Wzi family protein [Parapedobacter luteus]SKB48672.1 Capsule assembly protein Wzi [Parapedobacter luteus]
MINKPIISLIAIASLLAGMADSSKAQTIPVGTPLLEDYYRRQQLLGKLDSTISFSIRPLTHVALQPSGQLFAVEEESDYNGKETLLSRDKLRVSLLPVQWKNQLNSTLPEGWNDGAMIPSAGYQTMVSAGIYAEYAFLSVQLRPEYVLAQNGDYPGFNGKTQREWYEWYRRIGNQIDLPERFGDGWYSRLLPGQSSVRLNVHPVSIGISTENLWWGPGIYSSLLLSNTAPGFPHLTINTTRPIRTPIGSFEGQMVGGRLEGSGYPPKQMGNPNHYDQYYRRKSDDWRYFSGLTFTYQPKWLPGLSLGMARSSIAYYEEVKGNFRNYLPFLDPVSKSGYSSGSDSANADEGYGRDEYISVFARWVIKEANAEAYFEYGRNDHAWDMRDLFVQLEHSRAYTVGFRKLTALNWWGNDYLSVNVEVTQSEGPKDETIRPGGPWYRHHQVRHGYTHLGQMVGLGIGPGSNLQTLSISWVQGIKQLGVQYYRYVHNNDFFYFTYGDMRRNWVDMSMAVFGEWNYKNFLAHGKMGLTRAFNYQYELEEKPDLQNFWRFDEQDKFNFQLQLGVSYRF